MAETKKDYSYEEISKESDLQRKIEKSFENNNLTADELFALREGLNDELIRSQRPDAIKKLTKESGKYLDATLKKFTDSMLSGAGIPIVNIDDGMYFLKASGYTVYGPLGEKNQLLEAYKKIKNKSNAIFVKNSKGEIEIKDKLSSIKRTHSLEVTNAKRIKIEYTSENNIQYQFPETSEKTKSEKTESNPDNSIVAKEALESIFKLDYSTDFRLILGMFRKYLEKAGIKRIEDINISNLNIVSKRRKNGQVIKATTTDLLYIIANSYPSSQGDVLLSFYDRIINIEPKADNYYSRGIAYHSIGNNKLALKDLNKAIKLNPNESSYYAGRGNTYIGIGDNKRALSDFKKAIKLSPNSDAAMDAENGINFIEMKNGQ